jgi:hypothetical protein
MERNNLGLQTGLKPIVRTEFETLLNNLDSSVHEMREALADVGVISAGCGSEACLLTNIGSDMPDASILDVLDWIKELSSPDHSTIVKDNTTRAKQLESIVQMVVRKVEPIANSPYNRHDLPFLMRGLAHPRVQASLEDLNSRLHKVASYAGTESTIRQAA